MKKEPEKFELNIKILKTSRLGLFFFWFFFLQLTFCYVVFFIFLYLLDYFSESI
jgi:hypothetical protein